MSDVKYFSKADEDSGNNCIIRTKSIEPIIKSRINDFIVGTFCSTVYDETAPRDDIKVPPKNTPRIYWFICSGRVLEKTTVKKTPYSRVSKSIESPGASNDSNSLRLSPFVSKISMNESASLSSSSSLYDVS